MKMWIYGVGACALGAVLWWMKPGAGGGNAGGGGGAGAAEGSGRRSGLERSARHLSGEPGAVKRVTTLDGFAALTNEDWFNEERRPQLMVDFIRWAEDHPQEAVEYLARVPLSVRDEVACALAGSLIQEQSELAWGVLVDLPPSPMSQAMIQQLAMEYVEKSPEEALAWALALEPAADGQPDSDREAVIAAVLTAYSGRSPEKAMELAGANLPKGGLLGKTTVEIVQRWTQSAPGAAAAHVLAMPPGEVRDAALENLVRIWSADRPDDARKWVQELSDPETKAAAEGFLPGNRVADPR